MQASRMKLPCVRSPLCSLADRQEGMVFLLRPQHFDTPMRLRHQSRCQIANLQYCQNVDHSILSLPYCSNTCENNTFLQRICRKNVSRERLGTLRLPQYPVFWIITRACHCVDQVVVVNQRALARHQFVCEYRGYCVFACTRESVDPD
jgi:hypothetical protein